MGDDAAGAAIRSRLDAEGIGVAGLFATAEASTGTALIVVDPQGQNQIAVAPGANHRVTVEMVAARHDDLAWAQVVLCPLELPPPTVAWTLREAKSLGALTVFNPAPVQPLPDEVWPRVDYLTPNEGEAARLTGLADPESAAAALLARGVGTVVMTLGADGCPRVQPRGAAPRRRPDRHRHRHDRCRRRLQRRAGRRSRRGPAPGRCAALRPAAGALTCTRRGVQDALPTLAEVETLLGGDSRPADR